MFAPSPVCRWRGFFCASGSSRYSAPMHRAAFMIIVVAGLTGCQTIAKPPTEKHECAVTPAELVECSVVGSIARPAVEVETDQGVIVAL